MKTVHCKQRTLRNAADDAVHGLRWSVPIRANNRQKDLANFKNVSSTRVHRYNALYDTTVDRLLGPLRVPPICRLDDVSLNPARW